MLPQNILFSLLFFSIAFFDFQTIVIVIVVDYWSSFLYWYLCFSIYFYLLLSQMSLENQYFLRLFITRFSYHNYIICTTYVVCMDIISGWICRTYLIDWKNFLGYFFNAKCIEYSLVFPIIIYKIGTIPDLYFVILLVSIIPFYCTLIFMLNYNTCVMYLSLYYVLFSNTFIGTPYWIVLEVILFVLVVYLRY